jgi:hypothetical protein
MAASVKIHLLHVCPQLLIINKPHHVPFHRGDAEGEGIMQMVRHLQTIDQIPHGELYPVHR